MHGEGERYGHVGRVGGRLVEQAQIVDAECGGRCGVALLEFDCQFAAGYFHRADFNPALAAPESLAGHGGGVDVVGNRCRSDAGGAGPHTEVGLVGVEIVVVYLAAEAVKSVGKA